jgi:hypothetical protein
VAAGGAALSAGAGAVASAASALFGSVSGAGDGTASAAPPGGPRPHHSTGARPKRKVILVLQIFQLFPPYVVVDIGCRSWSEPCYMLSFQDLFFFIFPLNSHLIVLV